MSVRVNREVRGPGEVYSACLFIINEHCHGVLDKLLHSLPFKHCNSSALILTVTFILVRTLCHYILLFFLKLPQLPHVSSFL